MSEMPETGAGWSVLREASRDAWESWELRCSCGVYGGGFSMKSDAVSALRSHWRVEHGGELPEAPGAKPPATNSEMVRTQALQRDIVQLKAEQKDLLANFTEMAKVVREFRAFDLAETRRKLDLIDQLHREGLLLPAEARAALRPPEDGPGIAALPTPSRDTAVAWLDEDLLCDDA